jgi:hypothetical protein
VKKSPKIYPDPFLPKVMHNFYRGKKIAKNLIRLHMCVIFKILFKQNNCPTGENSPNLVTLIKKVLGFRDSERKRLISALQDMP